MKKHEVDLVGREVSCRVLEVLFAALPEKGLPPEALAEGVDYPPEHLLDKHQRIDWASFHRVMGNAGRIWRDEELIKLGGSAMGSPPLRPFWLVSAAMASVEGAYYHLVEPQGGGKLLYTCMQSTIQKVGSNHLVLERTVAEGYPPVREHFLLLKGALITLPLEKGLAAAVVEMEEIEAGVRYQIWLPEAKGWLAWLRRMITWPFTMRALVQELREALTALQEQYTTLQDEMARRVEAEAQLRYQADLLAHINDAVVATDTAFRVTAWNRAAERIFGWTEVEALGCVLSELVRLDINDEARNQIRRRLAESGEQSTERVAYHRDGGMVHIESIMIALYNEAGEVRGYVGVSRDITKRKQAKAALKGSEARYRTLVEQIPGVVYQTTLDKVSAPTYISPQIEQMTGYPPTMWTDEPDFFIRIVHPDDQAHLLAAVNETQAREKPFKREYRILARDGRVVWFRDEAVMGPDEAGQPAWVQGIMLDITDRKQAEAALAESQGRLQALLDYSQNAIMLANDEARYVGVNPATCRLFGYSQEELLELSVWDITPGRDKALIQKVWRNFIAAGWQNGEYRILRKDGTTLIMEYKAVANIAPGLHLSVLQDITERRRMEAEVRESRNQLRSILDTVPDYVLRIDRAGKIVFANRSHPGSTMADIIGSDYMAWVPKDYRPVFQAVMERAFETGEPQTLESRGQDLTGQQEWYLNRIGPVKEAGEVVGLTIVSTDVTEHKQADEALRESQRFIERIANTVPYMLYVYDRAKKHDVYINRYTQTFFGPTLKEPQQLETNYYLERVHPEDRAILEWGNRVADKTPDGQVYELEYRLRNGDGAYRWVRSYKTVLNLKADGTPRQILGTTVDITAHKEAEQALLESEERYRNLFENSPVSIWEEDFSEVLAYLEALNFREMADFERYLAEHPQVVSDCLERVKIVDVNQATLEMMKADEKSEVMMSLWQTAADKALKSFKQELLAVYRGQTRLKFETDTLRLDGVRRNIIVHWVIPPGYEETLARVLVSITDITERKRIEAALERQERKYRSLAENLPDVVARFDRKLRHIYVNRRIEDATGLPVQTYLGKSHLELNVPEALATYWAENVQAVLDSGQTRTIEFTFEGVNGPMHFETRIIPEFDAEGGVESVLGINQDITKRKQAEQEREKLIAELEAKNAELERFTYTVSHDLKSPLITIKGFLGHLEKDALAGDKKRLASDVKYIREAAETMGLLLDNLLALSRIGRMVNPSQVISLNELAAEAVKLLAGQIEARQVQIDISPGLPVVWGDRPRLLEVLQNLIDNAIKYTDNQVRPYVEIGVRAGDETRICYVRDNGIGIKPRYQQKIFDLFEQLDPNGEGTGIGLALVKRIIELHGGGFGWSRRVKGRGVCFVLRCRGRSISWGDGYGKTRMNAGAYHGLGKEEKVDPSEPKGEPLCILLVEDNAAHAELVTRSFERHRISNRIYHVTDGEAALDYLWRRGSYTDPQQSPRPHLILLDLRLPKINGLEVLKEIKTTPELQPIPVVILTTSEIEQDIKGAYEAHANSYLVKPVDFAKFTQLMQELGFYWLGWNHYPW